MSRIFIVLSVLPILLLGLTMTLGWRIGDYSQAYQELRKEYQASSANSGTEDQADTLTQRLEELETPRSRFRLHFLAGLATALVTVLMNSISVTYLIGTSRWVKEVCDAYDLSPTLVGKSTVLKRHTFPWSLAGILAVLTIIALGAASDPGTLRSNTGEWVLPHSTAAMIGGCLIVWAFFVQGINLHQNSEIIQQVLAEVRQKREERGLETEPSE